MALHVQLKTSKSASRPGQTHRTVIELTNNQSSGLFLAIEKVSVLCQGLEIIDPGWISTKYYSESPSYKKEGRKIVRTIFSSRSNQILEKLLFLGPGSEKQYCVSVVLPDKLPPSFKGTSVRYLYETRIKVAYRQAISRDSLSKESETMSLKKPFDVFPNYFDIPHLNNKTICGTDDVPLLEVTYDDHVPLTAGEISEDEHGSSTDGSILSKIVSESGESSSTAAAFRSGSLADGLSISRFSGYESEVSCAPIQPISRRTSSLTHNEVQMLIATSVHPQIFNLRFGSETVVLFSFNPSISGPLRPGSTIGGVLRLSELDRGDCLLKCQSYTVMLETEEKVEPEFQPDNFKECRVIRKLHCEQSEFTGDVLMTNFMFTIPSTATPTFKTPLLSVTWKLKFEFEVGRVTEWVDGEADKASNQTDPLHWELPLTVCPI